MPVEPSGFWSYVHLDDDAEQGRVADLADLLREEYALLNGEELRLFCDRDDLAWGEHWRERIDEALAGITFFIPVVTPRYFKSDECRRELLTFARRAKAARVGELLLPILYADVSGLNSDSDDEALAAVASVQWRDWRELRVEDSGSPAHRQGVRALAKRLVEIVDQVSQKPVVSETDEPVARRVAEASEIISSRVPASVDSPRDASVELGVLDLLVESEEALPRLATHLNAAAEVVTEIGSATEEATAQTQASDARGGGFAGRLRVANDLAHRLEDPSERLLRHASSYAADLAAVDPGLLTLIDLLGEEVRGAEPAERAQADEFVKGIIGMYLGSAENFGNAQEFSRQLGQSATFSRELRPPIETIQTAVRRIADGLSVIEGWVRRMGAAGFDITDAGLA
jgi:hypothetical protein